jgi:hypothetical protein
MDIAKIVESLALQAPAVAVLIYALSVVYADFKAERAVAAQERAEMIRQLTQQTLLLGMIAQRVGLSQVQIDAADNISRVK